MAEDPSNTCEVDNIVCVNAQADEQHLGPHLATDAGDGAVEEPEAFTELLSDAAADARHRQGPWHVASSPYDAISADKIALVSVLVLVQMILMRWYYTRRKKFALARDQKYMVGFCSIPTIEENSSNHKNMNQQYDDGVRRSSKHHVTNAAIMANHISVIREKQQKKLVMGNKRTQRQIIHGQQHIRKRTLHSDLNHRAADDAYVRRMNTIARESLLLQPQHEHIEQQGREVQQVHGESEEEVDRRTLLHQQDLEYQQSLQSDQHRARQLELKNDREMRRSRALDEARLRLAVAGIMPHCHDKGFDVKVRLLLPSGQKIIGSFSTKHSMGLIYDFALLALDTNKILWSPEDDGSIDINWHNNDGAEEDIDALARRDVSLTEHNIIYDEIQKEWRDLFFPFSIASSYPTRTYANLSSTLENCGFREHVSVALVVVVEFA